MTIVEVLKEARALVAAGWIQGAFASHGSYCALGAIREVDPSGEWRDSPATICLAKTLRPSFSGSGDAAFFVADYNDGTVGADVAPQFVDGQGTQAGVLAVFDTAIINAEKGAC